jgi:N-[(2S)-2-amino-2-carboxyethyl]-L-glutamate dehydrogenase
MLFLTGPDVEALLFGQEKELMQLVGQAYLAHARGDSSLPPSCFLRLPEEPRSRIIALPAYLGPPFDVAGVKWISSFPENRRWGRARASAVVVLNSMTTGRPEVILEGSLISAKRTAASAALAATLLSGKSSPGRIGLVGAGVINFEVLRFLKAALPGVRRLVVHDTNTEQSWRFAQQVRHSSPDVEVAVAPCLQAVLDGTPLVSFATTALQPHVSDLSLCPCGAVILHVSLRDLTPEVILAADNVVDDVDHVCHAQTSVHLAEQAVGHRQFIRGTLAEVLNGTSAAPDPERLVTVFSPFGLGILDVAVAKRVCDLARAQGRGLLIDSFFPEAWPGDQYGAGDAAGGPTSLSPVAAER